MNNKLKSTIGKIANVLLAVIVITFIVAITTFIIVRSGILTALILYGIFGFLIFIRIASDWVNCDREQFIEVEIELNDKILLQAMTAAHEANMTFNDWSNMILRKYIDRKMYDLQKEEKDDKFHKELKSFIER